MHYCVFNENCYVERCLTCIECLIMSHALSRFRASLDLHAIDGHDMRGNYQKYDAIELLQMVKARNMRLSTCSKLK